MANEIQWRGTETGVTLYATIRSASGTQWNTAGTPNFEAVTAANWADYDIALAESSGNYFYTGTFPAISGNMVAGWYWVDIYKRAGGTPAITDTLQGTVVGYWDGTSLLPWATNTKAISDDVAAADALEDVFDDATSVTNMKAFFDGTGYAGGTARLKVDLDTIKTQAITCAAGVTVLASVGTAATSTAQTGDTYALANGATGFTAIDTVVDAIKAKTDSLTFTVAGDLDANVQSWAGASVATPSVAGVPEVDLTHVNGVAASGSATVDANVTTIAAGAITAAAIATGAIDADALAADAGTEIGAAVKTAVEAAGSHLTLIKTKTDYLPSATAGAAGGVFIAGTNAPVTITGSGNALSLISTGADGSGLVATGNSNGHGIHATGGVGLTSWDIYSGGNGIKDVQDMITNYIDPILLDTDEMQKDLVNGGRIDLLIDSIITYVDCLPATWVTVPTAAQNRAEMDSNSTQLAAIKAKTDLGLVNTTWTDAKAAFLDAAVSEAGGGVGDGTGADEVTITWTSGGLPVADGDVWISTDPTGDNVVAGTLQTNDNGQATFMLDAGSVYFLWAQRSGVNSIRGERFVAVAD